MTAMKLDHRNNDINLIYVSAGTIGGHHTVTFDESAIGKLWRCNPYE